RHNVNRKRNALIVACIIAGLVALNYAPVAYASIFGEENATLVQMLVQLTESSQTLDGINGAVSTTADLTSDLVTTYQKVNAGIEAIEHYSPDAFFNDFKTDLYRQ